MINRDLDVDVAALMAACRLTLCPDDVAALSDLRERAGQMQAMDGETEVRRRFRVAAQACAVAPGPQAIATLHAAMMDFARADHIPRCPPPEDPRRGGRDRMRRPGCNGVAAAMPRDPDLMIDL